MRPIFVLALCALVAACGFEPLYGERRDVNVVSELSAVRIAPIPDRAGQILRNFLLDQLNPYGRSESNYVLAIDLREPQQEIGILRSDTATRIAYSAVVNYTLSDAAGHRLLAGSSSSNTTYTMANSPFATLAARFDSRDRALQQISQDIRQQLAAYFLDARKAR